MNTLAVVAVTVELLVAGGLVFRKVGHDYTQHGRLTMFAVGLELLIFFLHGSASYVYLDSVTAHIAVGAPWFWAAVALLVVGFAGVFAAMARLTWVKSVGRDFSGLRTTGLYRFSRNPQLVAYGLVVLGYALLWPSWRGLVWVAVYAAIAHMMALAEEAHLRRVYGAAYADYCRRVPRYVGVGR